MAAGGGHRHAHPPPGSPGAGHVASGVPVGRAGPDSTCIDSQPMRLPVLLLVPSLVLTACAPAGSEPSGPPLTAKYATVRLTADLGALSDNERAMLPLLMEAADEMDAVFWQQAWGNRDSLLSSIADPELRRFAEINYGPWDRLAGNEPFIPGVGPKPPGAAFYPSDLTREEYEAYLSAHPDQAAALADQYALVRRGEAGSLVAIPYHVAFADHHRRAAEKLRAAAALADDPGLRRYLELRAEALLTDRYQASDLAWLDMKQNGIDVVIGPIENYEDRLMGAKTGHEAYVLIKDRAWSDRLSRYAALLPALQRGIPVPEAYRRERPGTDSDLNAYDVVYYAGEANAGSKTIAINLPNDEEVQLQKGTRRLQLKNAMRAKFDVILLPIVQELIAPDQRDLVSFDAFFGNTMFHEVAHGLGIKNTVNGRGTVRAALREHGSPLEEAKADILGLYMSGALRERGELTEGSMESTYVTFLASIFRSVRFGASSAHGRGNMIQFAFFQERGAFTRDPVTGTYRVDFDRMREAVTALAQLLLTTQGNGDYEGAGRLLAERGVVPASLAPDLERLATKGIPVDIVFEQGMGVLAP